MTFAKALNIIIKWSGSLFRFTFIAVIPSEINRVDVCLPLQVIVKQLAIIELPLYYVRCKSFRFSSKNINRTENQFQIERSFQKTEYVPKNVYCLNSRIYANIVL